MERTAPARRWELRPFLISQARSQSPLALGRALEDTKRCAVAPKALSPTEHPMKKTVILSMLVLVAIAGAQTKRVAFEGTQAIHKFLLKDLGPDFPADWSAFEYLVLEMRTSTPQRFH